MPLKIKENRNIYSVTKTSKYKKHPYISDKSIITIAIVIIVIVGRIGGEQK